MDAPSPPQQRAVTLTFDLPHAQPSCSRPPMCLARRQRYRRPRQMTTDASEQNNTGSIGWPVISEGRKIGKLANQDQVQSNC